MNMAFVKQTLAEHSGSIRVSATPGVGTTLYFTWPSTSLASTVVPFVSTHHADKGRSSPSLGR